MELIIQREAVLNRRFSAFHSVFFSLRLEICYFLPVKAISCRVLFTEVEQLRHNKTWQTVSMCCIDFSSRHTVLMINLINLLFFLKQEFSVCSFFTVRICLFSVFFTSFLGNGLLIWPNKTSDQESTCVFPSGPITISIFSHQGDG